MSQEELRKRIPLELCVCKDIMVESMKYSIYNSILPLTKISSMIYNASSDKFIVFKKELESLLAKNPEEVQKKALDLYTKLKDGGFVVDDDTDEVADMISLGLRLCNNESSYRLIINPTTNCNFRCWYCYENHSPHAKMDSCTVDKVKRMIVRITGNEKINCIELSFFGGEPLLYYRDTVEPIIDAIRIEHEKNKNFTYNIHFTSNGYLINDYIIQHLIKDRVQTTFQITLDGGREQHNRVRFPTSGKGSYDRIINNIKKLLSEKINVSLRINYTMNNISSVESILDDLKDISEENAAFLTVDFQKVWQDTAIKYDDETLGRTLDAFRKRFKRVSAHYNHTDAFRHPCYADLRNESVINYNGDVYKCTARDFTHENRLGELNDDGTITWDDPDFVENRVCRKFNKEECNRCRIFPICGGGCAQNALENRDRLCMRYSSELEIDKVILMRFYNNVVRHTTLPDVK